MMIVVVYVNDLIFMGNKVELLEKFKELMKNEFEMIWVL